MITTKRLKEIERACDVASSPVGHNGAPKVVNGYVLLEPSEVRELLASRASETGVSDARVEAAARAMHTHSRIVAWETISESQREWAMDEARLGLEAAKAVEETPVQFAPRTAWEIETERRAAKGYPPVSKDGSHGE